MKTPKTPQLPPHLATELAQLCADLVANRAKNLKHTRIPDEMARRVGCMVLQLQDRHIPLREIQRIFKGKVSLTTLLIHSARELSRFEAEPTPKTTPKTTPKPVPRTGSIVVRFKGAVIECPSVEAAAALLRGLA